VVRDFLVVRCITDDEYALRGVTVDDQIVQNSAIVFAAASIDRVPIGGALQVIGDESIDAFESSRARDFKPTHV